MEETLLLRKLCETEGDVIDEHEVDANGTVINFKVYDWKDDIYAEVQRDGQVVLFQKLERKHTLGA